MPSIADLLAGGTIEQVVPDPAAARDELRMAQSHLASALLIVDTDPVLAHTALYDGVRKAISAHMRANGYRATPGPGHHVKVVAYGQAVLAGKNLDNEISQLDRLRTQRNSTEYGVRLLSDAQVKADLPIANAVVAALAGDLGL